MVDGIGRGGGGLAREAILAALKSQAKQVADVHANIADSPASSALGADGVKQTDNFTDQLKKGIEAVDAEIHKADSLPQDMIAGKVDDFHEVAVQLKQAEISFRFAMEVRNKLIDAYREVMRMNV